MKAWAVAVKRLICIQQIGIGQETRVYIAVLKIYTGFEFVVYVCEIDAVATPQRTSENEKLPSG